jgi:hypothetical protein
MTKNATSEDETPRGQTASESVHAVDCRSDIGTSDENRGHGDLYFVSRAGQP